jgi:hypothetical protein
MFRDSDGAIRQKSRSIQSLAMAKFVLDFAELEVRFSSQCSYISFKTAVMREKN